MIPSMRRVIGNAMLAYLLLGLLVDPAFPDSPPPDHNHLHHHTLKCEKMKLCSLGKVKPFLGDIYNSKSIHAHGINHAARPICMVPSCKWQVRSSERPLRPVAIMGS